MRIFETTVKTIKGAEMRAYFQDGKVVVDTPIGPAVVIGANKHTNTVRYSIDGKNMISSVVSGAGHVCAMLTAIEKEGREMVMFDSADEFAECKRNGSKFGMGFDVYDSNSEQYGEGITCAYKYSN